MQYLRPIGATVSAFVVNGIKDLFKRKTKYDYEEDVPFRERPIDKSLRESLEKESPIRRKPEDLIEFSNYF